MLALPESECGEILAYFRQHLPHIPDPWLQELATNYGLDAVVDIDPNDVIAILSVPGELHRIQIHETEREYLEKVCFKMHDELEARGIKSVQIVASLLIMQDSHSTLVDIGKIVKRVTCNNAVDVKMGWGWYSPSPLIFGQILEQFLIVRP